MIFHQHGYIPKQFRIISEIYEAILTEISSIYRVYFVNISCKLNLILVES